MAMIYVPERFEDAVRLTVCELRRKELLEKRREARKKDERTNKEKRTKKENKKKEEIKKSKRNKKEMAMKPQVSVEQTQPVAPDRRKELDRLVFSQSERVGWLARQIALAAERTNTPQDAYTARQIVDDAKVVVSMPDVYKGLTAEVVTHLLGSIDRPLNSDIILQMLYAKQLSA